jgi:hypothetical protein
MTNDQFCSKWGMDDVALESLRRLMGGVFRTTHRRPASRMGVHNMDLAEMSRRGMLPPVVPGEDMVVLSAERHTNIVTNEGLDHMLDATLSGATQITAWKVAIFKTNTTPLATHTYAVPGYTEIAGSNVDEAVRQAWTDAGVSSQAVTNAASPAVYTAADTWEAFGAAMVGGGSGAATIADTAGGGTEYSASLYAASKPLTDDDSLSTGYELGLSDDGA